MGHVTYEYRVYCPCGCGWGWEAEQPGYDEEAVVKGYDPEGNQDAADADLARQARAHRDMLLEESRQRGVIITARENAAGAVYGRTVIPNPINPETGRRKYD